MRRRNSSSVDSRRSDRVERRRRNTSSPEVEDRKLKDAGAKGAKSEGERGRETGSRNTRGSPSYEPRGEGKVVEGKRAGDRAKAADFL